jgi:FkbH-like protein
MLDGSFHLADRLGDYGLIGVIFCRLTYTGAWEIDTWLMSCRVLGREMEKLMFDRLIEAAQELGVPEVYGIFRRTEKNILVEGHYDRLGFERIHDAPSERRYRLAIPVGATLTATHIRHEGR